MRHRRGYDYNKSPCDPRYAPPEQFIDEGHWAKFDVYCVGLILVRVLFPPLWGGQHFDEFSDSYHAAACRPRPSRGPRWRGCLSRLCP